MGTVTSRESQIPKEWRLEVDWWQTEWKSHHMQPRSANTGPEKVKSDTCGNSYLYHVEKTEVTPVASVISTIGLLL